MKENQMNNAELPVAQPVEPKTYVVNCPKCGAALNVKAGGFAYMCPVCSNLFRVRVGEKLVKDVSRVTMMEAYVNVNQGANLPQKEEDADNE